MLALLALGRTNRQIAERLEQMGQEAVRRSAYAASRESDRDELAGQRLQERDVLHHVAPLRHQPGAVVEVLPRGARLRVLELPALEQPLARADLYRHVVRHQVRGANLLPECIAPIARPEVCVSELGPDVLVLEVR